MYNLIGRYLPYPRSLKAQYMSSIIKVKDIFHLLLCFHTYDTHTLAYKNESIKLGWKDFLFILFFSYFIYS